MTFWKPGTSAPGAEDLSRASENINEQLPYLYNPRNNLPLSQQRSTLPIAKHRLFLHSVMIIIACLFHQLYAMCVYMNRT